MISDCTLTRKAARGVPKFWLGFPTKPAGVGVVPDQQARSPALSAASTLSPTGVSMIGQRFNLKSDVQPI